MNHYCKGYRSQWQCSRCGHRTSLTSGTVMHGRQGLAMGAYSYKQRQEAVARCVSQRGCGVLADFPQKNIITRAMQPHMAKRHKADVYVFDDIQGGDYLFLCSDGVLEKVSNEDLCGILADSSLDDSRKLSAIKAMCYGKTKDNYTCWLVPIEEVGMTDMGRW